MPSQAAAVLLDVDGTLVDSNYLHTMAWARAFAEHGVEVATSTIHHCIGMGAQEMLQSLLGEAREDLSEAHSRHMGELRAEMRRLPGAQELLRALKHSGLRVVLATSAKADEVDALRKVIDSDDAIDAVTSSQDVENAKPAPDLFLTAAEAAGVPPERAIAVGDTVWDVRAATAAGMRCVCVCTGGIGAHELREAGAAAVYDDCRDLLRWLDQSPIAALRQG